MQTLRSMMIFVQVAESGSFTKAAQQLDLSVPSVSVVVSKLEEELRVKLLNRSTRSLALTEAGKVFYRGCCRTLDEARQTHENMFAFNERPSGVLRIGCSPSMAHYVITHISAQLLERFPGLSVNLVTASPAPDLISHGLDLILRFGEIEDSGLYTRKVGSMPMVVCAAVSYLNKMGRPVHPDDIEKFDWLEYDIQPDNTCNLTSRDGSQIRIRPKGRYITNDSLALIDWLRAGRGIAFVPMIWVIKDIAQGNVEVLFSDFRTESRSIFALHTSRDNMPLKVKACIEELTEFLTKSADDCAHYLR
ncbi:TPA: LysR substrate-binding domain-containing protein [Klebsiella variicola]